METQYRFTLSDGRLVSQEIVQDETGLITSVGARDAQFDPEVTKLATAQCTHCPLSTDEYPNCPLAERLCPVVARFSEYDSYTPARVTVTTEQRQYACNTTMQQGLRSLLGLVMGGSGCPYMAFFRPLARFHLPFSSEKETTFRAIANLAMASSLLNREGNGGIEIEALETIYSDIQTLNDGVAERLRLMARSDATANAIVLLDMFAKFLGNYLEEGLDELAPLYSDFLALHGKPRS